MYWYFRTPLLEEEKDNGYSDAWIVVGKRFVLMLLHPFFSFLKKKKKKKSVYDNVITSVLQMVEHSWCILDWGQWFGGQHTPRKRPEPSVSMEIWKNLAA